MTASYPLKPGERAGAEALLRALSVLRGAAPEMTLAEAETLLIAAIEQPVEAEELQWRLGGAAPISRAGTLAAALKLTGASVNGRRGPALLAQQVDDRKTRRFALNQTGGGALIRALHAAGLAAGDAAAGGE